MKKIHRKKRKKQPWSAKGIVVQDGKVLLLRQKNGKWDLPGGKADKGEEIGKALKREVEEETGLKVKRIKPVHKHEKKRKKKKNLNVVSFLCTTKGKLKKKKVSLSKEHKDFQLVDIKKARKLKKLRKPHRKAIKAAHRILKN